MDGNFYFTIYLCLFRRKRKCWIKHITGMLNNYTRFNFFFIFKFSFGGKKDVVCNIKRKSVNTFKYSHGYSLISFSSYSEKTRSLNIIEVSNWIFRDWILYKETILTLWGHVLWRDVFKKEFPEYRLERKCCVTITRREEGVWNFSPSGSQEGSLARIELHYGWTKYFFVRISCDYTFIYKKN